MSLIKKLQDLGEDLPEVAAPAANYVPYVVENGFVSISGQLPFLNGEKMHIGKSVRSEYSGPVERGFGRGFVAPETLCEAWRFRQRHT